MTGILSANSIHFKYRPSGNSVLSDVSIQATPGKLVALLGPNGSGKSTLLKILAGLIPPSQGSVSFGAQDFLKWAPLQRAKEVVYVPAYFPTEFPMTAYEAVMMGRTALSTGFMSRVSEKDRSSVNEALQLCQCSHLRDRMLHELSGGERQLVALARAIAQGAKILVLDEALSQMDLSHQSLIGRMLENLVLSQSYAIILVAHDVNLAAEWASDCILLKDGKTVAAGSSSETLTQANIEKLYPDAQLKVSRSPFSGKPGVFF
jgi:iron complex transport system ATP-binding protein